MPSRAPCPGSHFDIQNPAFKFGNTIGNSESRAIQARNLLASFSNTPTDVGGDALASSNGINSFCKGGIIQYAADTLKHYVTIFLSNATLCNSCDDDIKRGVLPNTEVLTDP